MNELNNKPTYLTAWPRSWTMIILWWLFIASPFPFDYIVH